MKHDNSHVSVGPGGVAFVGPDAVALFRGMALERALRFYADTGMQVNRAYTPTAMLRAASCVTSKTYKRGQYRTAAADVKTWCDAMRAAMPVVQA